MKTMGSSIVDEKWDRRIQTLVNCVFHLILYEGNSQVIGKDKTVQKGNSSYKSITVAIINEKNNARNITMILIPIIIQNNIAFMQVNKKRVLLRLKVWL